MSHDILHQATRSLRECTPERPQVGDLTRARIMRSLHQQRRRKVTRTLVWFPLAAIFIGASAAAATGRLPQVWNVVSAVVGIEPTRPAPRHGVDAASGRARPLHRMAVPRSENLPKPAPAPPSPEPVAVPEAPEVSDTSNTEPAHVRAVAPSTHTTATVALTPEQEEAYALYRTAHTAHFVERSPSRALAAWNRYLARFPNDRLAPEARYNRALCLVRLGRYAEASPALTRFASGQYGSYRRRDAQRLLEAISPLGDEKPAAVVAP